MAVTPETVPYEPLPRALGREVGHDGVLVVTIDVPGERVNTLGKSMMAEFDTLLGELETPGSVKAATTVSSRRATSISASRSARRGRSSWRICSKLKF